VQTIAKSIGKPVESLIKASVAHTLAAWPALTQPGGSFLSRCPCWWGALPTAHAHGHAHTHTDHPLPPSHPPFLTPPLARTQLNANENIYGAPPAVVAALGKAGVHHIYPDPTQFALRTLLVSVLPSCVARGCYRTVPLLYITTTIPPPPAPNASAALGRLLFLTPNLSPFLPSPIPNAVITHKPRHGAG